ncbi:MAG TPA: hypothetical protein VE959_16115 [Bryobacteraceae bacterium]|nr:hypothetical protein [Bryobacteraceae bacterium]
MTKSKIGELDAGGIYVGKSATTGEDLHAALADESKYLTFDEAFQAAAEMRKQRGRENAHVPTLAELEFNLFANKDKGQLKGTFNTLSAKDHMYPEAAPYRSSHLYFGPRANMREQSAWTVWFEDGFRDLANGQKSIKLPVRLVW